MKKTTKKHLPNSDRVTKVQDMRQIVLSRMKAKNLSAYSLAKITGVLEQSIYNFTAKGKAMRNDNLEKLFAALDIEVRIKADSVR